MKNYEKFKTAEERTAAFDEYCESKQRNCIDCKLITHTRNCHFAWLELEAKNPLHPCPFCGGEADVFRVGSKVFVRCIECGATPHTTDTEDKAIELWNRRAQ